MRCLNLWDNVFLGKNDYSSPTNLVASYSSSSSLTSSSASSNNTNNVTPRTNNGNVNSHHDNYQSNHGSNFNNGHFIDPFSGLSITSTKNIIQSNSIHQGNGTHDNGIVQGNGIHRNGDNNVEPPLPSTDSDQKMDGHLSNGFHHSNTNGYSENGCGGSSRRHATMAASNHNGTTAATDSVVMNNSIDCSENTENNIVINPTIDINERSSSADTVAMPITSTSDANMNGVCVEDNLSRDSEVTERDECCLVSTKKNNEEDDRTLVDGETTVSQDGVALPVDTYGQMSSAFNGTCDSTMTDSCRTLTSSEHNIHNASSGGSSEHRTSLDDLCLASGCVGVSGIIFTI